jgi:hypothetical protein
MTNLKSFSLKKNSFQKVTSFFAGKRRGVAADSVKGKCFKSLAKKSETFNCFAFDRDGVF